MAPDLRRGTNPALTTDDFPMPDGPTTMVRPPDPTCSTSSSTSVSLPKKSAASASLKAPRPLYGLRASVSAGSAVPPRPAATASSSTMSRTDRGRSCGSGAVAQAMTSPSDPPMCTAPPLPGVAPSRRSATIIPMEYTSPATVGPAPRLGSGIAARGWRHDPGGHRGQPQPGDERCVRGVEHHRRRCQVTVDDPVVVGMGERRPHPLNQRDDDVEVGR